MLLCNQKEEDVVLEKVGETGRNKILRMMQLIVGYRVTPLGD